VRQYIPLIIESGFSAIEPLECRANNDIRELKEKWGKKIAFIGNISVEALSGTKKQIEDEVVSKVMKAKEGGGYIFHSDHSVPPTVSWKNYCYAIKVAKEVGKYK
jgi:uroporphyrinogen decarboxylase